MFFAVSTSTMDLATSSQRQLHENKNETSMYAYIRGRSGSRATADSLWIIAVSLIKMTTLETVVTPEESKSL